MKTNIPLIALLGSLSGCYQAQESAPPASFNTAAVIPARPTDTSQPLAAVIWALNYDLRQFDTVWAWLHDSVPPGPERARAIGAAALVASAELDRLDLGTEGIAAFDTAIPSFPTDARLPAWRAYIVHLLARDARDSNAIGASLDELRAATHTYPAFTLFGVTLAVAGYEDASPALIEETRSAYDTVFSATSDFQTATGGVELERSRRIWDTPIAPFNIPATQAMAGDLALRAGRKDDAQRYYYTALHSNGAPRWAWRGEVQRRLDNIDAVMAGLNAHPATEYSLGARGKRALGVPDAVTETRMEGRVGNGSCTICHSHISVYDLNEAPAEVGWIKGRIAMPKGVPNMQPIAFALPDGKDPLPAGFGIGPWIDTAGPRDFPAHDELYDGTFIIPAGPGRWFVALQLTVDGVPWQGYLARELTQQWFLDVQPGAVLDVSDHPIEMKPVTK